MTHYTLYARWELEGHDVSHSIIFLHTAHELVITEGFKTAFARSRKDNKFKPKYFQLFVLYDSVKYCVDICKEICAGLGIPCLSMPKKVCNFNPQLLSKTKQFKKTLSKNNLSNFQ